MVWHKILRTQTKIGRTQLVGPPVHIPRRSEQMPDQKEIGLDLCQINFSWSGPDCYLPNSDSTCHPPTWVERTSFFAERENTRKCHSFLKKANQNFDVKIIKNEKSENFAFLPAGSFSWLRLRTRTTFWGSKLPVSWTQVCNNEVSLLLGILICHIFALENARKIGILAPLFVMSISLIDQIVMKM